MESFTKARYLSLLLGICGALSLAILQSAPSSGIVGSRGRLAYAAVVDAGSTGSRAYLAEVGVDAEGRRSLKVSPARKVTPGLSSFHSHPQDAAAYLSPALRSVLPLLPQAHAGEPPPRLTLHVRGTAGMRLLPEDDQVALWNLLYEGLCSDPIISSLFDLQRGNFGTISGNTEAYYAILAANYVAGNIDGNLRSVPGSRLVGAVDMGGSSTQLVVPHSVPEGEAIGQHHFWSHSWLEFGAEKFQERMWDHFRSSLERRRSVLKKKKRSGYCLQVPSELAVSNEMEVCPAVPVLLNPCIFRGHVEPMEFDYIDDGDDETEVVLVEGTGDANECMKLIHSILWPVEGMEEREIVQRRRRLEENPGPASEAADTDGEDKDEEEEEEYGGSACTLRGQCPIDSVHVPRIQDLHFYGMSAYFYALDSVRELGPVELPHWPRPSIEELEEAVNAFCSMDWMEDGKHLKSRHKYTSDDRLQFRCLEANYILALLRHGFGFEPHHRNITLALEVKGTEVEWTLGYALENIPPFSD